MGLSSQPPVGFNVEELLYFSKNGRNIKLAEPLIFVSKTGMIVTYQIGGLSDMASTPPILWEKFDLPWIPPFGWYFRPTVLHDGCYKCSTLSKEICDNLFLESMLWCIEQGSLAGETNFVETEERKLKAKIIYEGVTIGGWKSFDEDRKKQTDELRKLITIS